MYLSTADYATKNDLPSSYSREERKLYQRIIKVIDSFFIDVIVFVCYFNYLLGSDIYDFHASVITSNNKMTILVNGITERLF